MIVLKILKGRNMKYYKGFNKGLECRGMQYEENTVFEMKGKPIICEKGFHFCTNPIDVLDYYPLIQYDGEISEFAEVEICEDSRIHKGLDKSCTNKLKIKNKIPFFEYIELCFQYMFENRRDYYKNYDNKLIKIEPNSLIDFDRIYLYKNTYWFNKDYNRILFYESYSTLVNKSCNSQIIFGEDNTKIISKGNGVIIQTAHNDIHRTKILSRGEKVAIYIDKNDVNINASLGTRIIFRNSSDIWCQIYVDGEEMLPNTTYRVCQGEVDLLYSEEEFCL